MSVKLEKVDKYTTLITAPDSPGPIPVFHDGELASNVDLGQIRMIEVKGYEHPYCPEARTFVGEYPVTMEQYLQFCAATGHRIPSDEGWGYGQQPAINVNEGDVACFINYINELYGFPFRYEIIYNEDGSYKEYKMPELVDPETGKLLEGFKLPDQQFYTYYVGDVDKIPNKEQVIVHSGNSNNRAQPVTFAVDPETGEDLSRNEHDIPQVAGNVWHMVETSEYVAPYFERAKKNYLKHKNKSK
jgi:hypothetical protein